MSYDWPGNVRELRNAVTYAVAMSPGRTIGLEHLPQKLRAFVSSSTATAMADARTSIPSDAPPVHPPLTTRQQAQQAEIIAALTESDNNVSQAARLLGIHRTTLINRMLRLGLRLSKRYQYF